MRILSCYIFVVLFFVRVCISQECMTACSLNLTACNNIDYLIYVTDLTEVADGEENASELINFVVTNTGDQTCIPSFSRFICNYLHPSCDSTNTTVIRPCSAICYEFKRDCAPYLLAVPTNLRPLLNCTDPNYYVTPDQSEECSNLTNLLNLCENKNAGACQKFNPALAPLYGELCAPFVSENIWVPEDIPDIQSILDQTDPNAAAIFKANLPIAPLQCTKSIMSILCPLVFPTCFEVFVPEFNSTVFVPQQVCHSFCDNTYVICDSYFLEANITDALPEGGCERYNYPTSNPYLHLVNGVLVNVPCRDTLYPPNPYQSFTGWNVSCPAETGKKMNPTEKDAPCGLRCPDASYSLDEWHTIVIATQIGSSISLVCMFFLIISYLVIFEKRQFPTNLHLNEFIATLLFSMSFLLGGPNPEKNVWCADEGTNATQSNNARCGVQGFFFIFFGLALTAWCCVIAFNIFYTLVLNRAQNSLLVLLSHRNSEYIFGWGLPLIFAIAAVASGSIGYGPPLAWCFIHFNGFGFGHGLSMDYPLFYIPIGVLFIVILVLFSISIGVLVHMRRVRLQVENSGFDIYLRTQIRVLIFIFVIVAIFFTIFEWRIAIQSETDRKQLTEVGLNWAYCKMKIALGIINPGYCPGNTNPARIDYSHTVLESFLLSGIGFLIFVAFGLDQVIFQHWVKMFSLIANKEWDKLKTLVTKGGKFSQNRAKASLKVSGSSKSDNSKSENSKSHNEDPHITGISVELNENINT